MSSTPAKVGIMNERAAVEHPPPPGAPVRLGLSVAGCFVRVAGRPIRRYSCEPDPLNDALQMECCGQRSGQSPTGEPDPVRQLAVVASDPVGSVLAVDDVLAVSRQRQRALGAYYSPQPYARALVRWATEGGRHSVMDPSYGGCALLREAVEHLSTVVEDAAARIYGADIDTGTASWAAHLMSMGVPPANLVSADFLTLRAGRELPKVAALVGNPPYVRHHALSDASRAAARAAADAAGVYLNGRASLWAYFVVHAVGFVAPGGRMALLLPGAIFQADYATTVIKHLCVSFGAVELVRVRERLFHDAEEETVVLLADNAGATSATATVGPRVTTVDNLAALERHLSARHKQGPLPGAPDLASGAIAPTLSRRVLEAVQPWKLDALPAGCAELFAEVCSHRAVSTLGEVAKVRIGTVTGANDFFLLPASEAEHLGVSEHTVRAVTRSAELIHPVLKPELDVDAVSVAKRLLVLPPDLHIDGRSRLGRRIARGEGAGYPLRRHCQRDPWWALPTPAIPDAFLPCMGGGPRGLVVNEVAAASTNAIHHVEWHAPGPAQHRILGAWSTWSALGRLAAELYGRHYGGGVLKLEISDARRLPYLNSDELLERDVEAASRQLQVVGVPSDPAGTADAVILRSLLNLSASEVQLLRTGAAILARLRKPPRLNSLLARPNRVLRTTT